MKELIEKLIGRLEEKSVEITFQLYPNDSTSFVPLTEAISIVNQLAEEYNKTSTEYINCSTDTSTNTSSGWIPCSSGTMPNENEIIMLTFKNSAGLHVGEATYKNRMFFYVTDTEFGYYEEVYKNPIAWKTKDAPYQPKGE